MNLLININNMILNILIKKVCKNLKNKKDKINNCEKFPIEIYLEIMKNIDDIKTLINFSKIKEEIYNEVNIEFIKGINIELIHLEKLEKKTNIISLEDFNNITKVNLKNILLDLKSKNEIEKYINFFKYFDIDIYHFIREEHLEDDYDKLEYYLEDIKNDFTSNDISDNFIFEVNKRDILKYKGKSVYKKNREECDNVHDLKILCNLNENNIKILICYSAGVDWVHNIDFSMIFNSDNKNLTIKDIIYICNWYKKNINNFYFRKIYNKKVNENLLINNKFVFKKIENKAFKPFGIYENNEFNNILINITKYDIKRDIFLI